MNSVIYFLEGNFPIGIKWLTHTYSNKEEYIKVKSVQFVFLIWINRRRKQTIFQTQMSEMELKNENQKYTHPHNKVAELKEEKTLKKRDIRILKKQKTQDPLRSTIAPIKAIILPYCPHNIAQPKPKPRLKIPKSLMWPPYQNTPCIHITR
jgi:hypothetical protein